MSGKVRDECKLNYSNRGLTDDAVRQLRLDQDSRNKEIYEEIDFSQNKLTSHGLHAVLKVCHSNSKLRILKLYKNDIDDEGAQGLADLCKALPWIEEIHLSHNHITDKGIDLLVTAAVANRPERATPLWLRVEQNDIKDPMGAYEEFKRRFDVCLRYDENACAVRHCKYGAKIHLPHFDKQRGCDERWGKGSGKRRWKEKEEEARPSVVLTARSDIDPPANETPRDARREDFSSMPKPERTKARRRRETPREQREHHNGDRHLDGHDRGVGMLDRRATSRHQRGSERSGRHDPSRDEQHRGGDFVSPRHSGGTPGRSGGEPRRDRRERGEREPRDGHGMHRRERRGPREVAARRDRVEARDPRDPRDLRARPPQRDERCPSRRRRRYERERLPEQHRERQVRSRRPRSPGRPSTREAAARRPGVEERRPKRHRYDASHGGGGYSTAGPPPHRDAHHQRTPMLALPAPTVLPNSEVGQAWGAPAYAQPPSSARHYMPPVQPCATDTGMECSYSSSSSFSDAEDGPPGTNAVASGAAVPGVAAPGSFVAAARVPATGTTAVPTQVEDDYSSPTFSDSLSDEGVAPPAPSSHPVPTSQPVPTASAEVTEGRPRSVQRSLPSSEMSPDFAAEQPDGVGRDGSSSCERERQWEQDRGCPPPSPSRSRSRDGNGPSGKTRMEALKERLTQKWQKKRTN
mmetsp:Transcript_18199/g.28677  ORF Transcript_18199/g.28677 Transcript_18199/m.28677 type:complete len:692 (+) Transcript_18199:124-2199(+)